MKKFVNDVDDILKEALDGFGRAHADLVSVHHEPTFVTRREPTRKGKVALISGGGSGHEPLHAGFVGLGMLDAACPGAVFTSPTPDQMAAAAEAVENGGGVLFIVKNYEGDVMNFEMAAEMITCEQASIITNDDCAVEDSTYTTGRRGVAGTVVVEKMVGALAEQGGDLGACQALGQKVNGATRSMGVAFTSCTVPAAGTPTFAIGDDEIEMGVGIHGEPGRKRIKMKSADAIVEEMIDAIAGDLGGSGDALLLVNGFGATPTMELYLVYAAAAKRLESKGFTVARSLVGNLCTSLDMAGCSLTVTRLDDDLKGYWDAPARTAGLSRTAMA
ncbi:MAG: dihydroxyacetone kinase subunit DhaK [Alphaproteobacteria bacterium]|nr:dihydroxyacetone kinase subunit DhaK [Alphaproteobacteria bacterium]